MRGRHCGHQLPGGQTLHPRVCAGRTTPAGADRSDSSRAFDVSRSTCSLARNGRNQVGESSDPNALTCRWSQWVSATLPDLRRLRWRVGIGGCRRRMRMRSGRGCELVMRPSRRLVRWGSRPVGCGATWSGVAGSGLRAAEVAGSVELGRAGGDLEGSGGWVVVACDRDGLGVPRRRSVGRSPGMAAAAGTALRRPTNRHGRGRGVARRASWPPTRVGCRSWASS